MLSFVRALARTRWWQRLRGKFTRVAQPYIRADALKRTAQFHVVPRFELFMTLVAATSFSLWAAANSGRAAHGGVWAAGITAFCGTGEQVRYAAVRVGAGADALVVTPSWQVHARCTTLHSSGRAKAHRSIPRWALVRFDHVQA